MSCICKTVVEQEKKTNSKNNKILRRYAELEKFAQSEDSETLKKIVKSFEKFFAKKDHKTIRRLNHPDVLNSTITDEHRENDPLDESQEGRDINGDSLLFRAMSIQAEEGSTKKETLKEIIQVIVTNCRWMIVLPRNNDKCKGITPLHVAILKEDEELLSIMATALQTEDEKMISKERIDAICAAPVFQNTPLMAGTLLGAASLNFNEDIFCIVYKHLTSKLDSTNKMGDTIVHSLIKYAHAQPDKMNEALKMLRYIMNCDFINKKSENFLKSKKYVRKLLMMKNKEKLNPLQLAAKRQQYDFFEYIMQHEVYHSKESNDGLYSENAFDITEIETFALKNDVTATDDEHIKSEYHESVLEYIVHFQTSDAFPFANFLPVRQVIKKKWKYYRQLFWGWFAIHFIFMIILSVAAVYRSKLKPSATESSEVEFEYLVTKNIYITAVSVVGLTFGLIYFGFECARLHMSRFQFKTSSNWFKSRKRHLTTPYSNFIFRIYFAIFYLLLCVDFFVALAAGQASLPNYHNNCLIFAVIIGWYLLMFFLQGFKPFSFFTVLIQTVIIDMIKFAFVMLIFLVAFSTAMFMIMQGASTEEDDFNHFGKTMLKMLTIMLGIGELGILFQARQPIMAIIVFVFFVFFTTILLLNALIALMSNSCTDLMTNYKGRVAMKMHCRLQKLSVILFLESYLPRPWCKEVGGPKKKQWYENNEWDSNMHRRFWSLSSPQENREIETEDPSDPVHSADQQNIFTLLAHHMSRGSKTKQKKKKSKGTISPDFMRTTAPVVQRCIDITDIERKTCNSCKNNELVLSQSQEVKEFVLNQTDTNSMTL